MFKLTLISKKQFFTKIAFNNFDPDVLFPFFLQSFVLPAKKHQRQYLEFQGSKPPYNFFVILSVKILALGFCHSGSFGCRLTLAIKVSQSTLRKTVNFPS